MTKFVVKTWGAGLMEGRGCNDRMENEEGVEQNQRERDCPCDVMNERKDRRESQERNTSQTTGALHLVQQNLVDKAINIGLPRRQVHSELLLQCPPHLPLRDRVQVRVPQDVLNGSLQLCVARQPTSLCKRAGKSSSKARTEVNWHVEIVGRWA